MPHHQIIIPAAEPSYVPAEVGGENVNALVLGEQRVESASVRPVDAVALLGRPEAQLAAVEQMIILFPSLKFFLLVSLFLGAACGARKICTLAAKKRYHLHLNGGEFNILDGSFI